MKTTLLFTALALSFGCLANAATDQDCASVRAEFKDSQQLSGSPIYLASVDRAKDGHCFIQLTFFGDRNMLDFLEYRTANHVRPDQESTASGPVPFFVNTPTIMQDIFLGPDGKALDPFGSESECSSVANDYKSVEGVSSTNVVAGPQSFSASHCYVEVRFKDSPTYLKFVQARSAAVDDFLLDKALLKRPGAPTTFMVFVPLWFSVR